jgi:hypothetical protein
MNELSGETWEEMVTYSRQCFGIRMNRLRKTTETSVTLVFFDRYSSRKLPESVGSVAVSQYPRCNSVAYNSDFWAQLLLHRLLAIQMCLLRNCHLPQWPVCCIRVKSVACNWQYANYIIIIIFFENLLLLSTLNLSGISSKIRSVAIFVNCSIPALGHLSVTILKQRSEH